MKLKRLFGLGQEGGVPPVEDVKKTGDRAPQQERGTDATLQKSDNAGTIVHTSVEQVSREQANERRLVIISYEPGKLKVEPRTYKEARSMGISDDEWNRAEVVKN